MTCSQCHEDLDPLDEFPGRRCLKCYESAIDNGTEKLMSFQDMTRAFGGK